MAGIYFHAANSTPPAIGGIDANTVLMLHLDGDQSDSQHTVTANGNPQFSTAQSKFGGSSMLFDGSGDYLTIPDSDDWALSNIWTLDAWIYITTGGLVNYIISQDQDANNRWAFGVNNSNKLVWNMKTGGTWSDPEPLSSGNVPLNEWVHIAAVADGSNLKLYINGFNDGTFSNRTLINMNALLKIGAGYESWLFNGYIDELRISKGIARWTSNFSGSLPSAPYTSDANTKLLLHMNGDVSDSAHVVTSNGTIQSDPTTSKFNGAMYFDGNDYFSIPDSPDWSFGGGDFTIDFWFMVKDNTYRTMYASQTDLWMGQFTYLNKMHYFASSDGLTWDLLLGEVGNGIGSITINNDTWYHSAFVRNGNTWKGYINGVEDLSVSVAGSIVEKSENINIGRWGAGGYWMYGWIDELRISKGIARWTSNFTPETGPYTT